MPTASYLSVFSVLAATITSVGKNLSLKKVIFERTRSKTVDYFLNLADLIPSF